MRWLMICLSLILTSCSYSPIVKVEGGGLMALNHYQTFSVEEQFLTSLEDVSYPLSLLPATLKNMLESALVEKNLSLSRETQVPDITIQLLVNQRSAWDVFDAPRILSVSHPYEYYLVHGFHYDIGVVTIRMIESNNGKLIWKAEVLTPLVHDEQQAVKRLKEHVGKLFL